MNGKDLLNSLGFVDDELVQEAEVKKMKKSPIRLFIPIAASFTVVAAAFSMWASYQNIPPLLPDDPIQPVASEDPIISNKEYTLYFNDVSGQTADRISVKGHFWETLTPVQAEKLLPNIAEKYHLEGIVNYSREGKKTSIYNVNTRFEVKNREVKITVAPGEIIKCYLIEGEPVLSEIEGIQVEAGIYVTDENSTGEQNYIYHADFKIGDAAYYVAYSGKENDQEFFTSVIADIILGGEADFSVVENPAVPKLRDDKLTEKEAYAEADFGAYLPKLPEKYLFNSAVRFTDQESDYLFASWSQRYADASITISRQKEQDMERLVSTSDKALYDMSLYPAPWADSMPEDTREIIENPVFKIEDLTLDVVKMRVYTRGERGDASGNSASMRFSVLYDDILVEVATEGISPAYLFDALSVLPRN